METKIGIHLGRDDPLGQGAARGADCVQFFLGDPQGWKVPPPGPDAAELAAADMVVYVHAPYGINLASPNNRIRIPSRKLLQQHMDAAAEIGARGLIVHGGHVNKTDDPAVGFDNWRKAIEATDLKIPLLIENTAGGDNAMARQAERIGRVFDAVAKAEGAEMVGFCLDTCHAHAGGIALDTAVERLRSLTGRIDLVHANDSRDAFDSGADRHATFGTGQIDPTAIADVCRAAGSDVIVETPAEGQVDDIDYLRSSI